MKEDLKIKKTLLTPNKSIAKRKGKANDPKAAYLQRKIERHPEIVKAERILYGK